MPTQICHFEILVIHSSSPRNSDKMTLVSAATLIKLFIFIFKRHQVQLHFKVRSRLENYVLKTMDAGYFLSLKKPPKIAMTLNLFDWNFILYNPPRNPPKIFLKFLEKPSEKSSKKVTKKASK